eukprot:GFYU01003209.1.p1 GENE.GFYU01003209.1~~GFYU01003209.1.p1  ORF type:complete len:504 (+),score=197.38 GFYU01003209.1:159-1670(+)
MATSEQPIVDVEGAEYATLASEETPIEQQERPTYSRKAVALGAAFVGAVGTVALVGAMATTPSETATTAGQVEASMNANIVTAATVGDSVDEAAVWSKWTKALADMLGQEETMTTAYMIATAPIEARWNETFARYDYTNTIDNAPMWKSTYDKSGVRVSQQYGQIMDQLKRGAGTKPVDMDKHRDEMEAARQNLDDFNMKWSSEWLDQYRLQMDPSYPPWMRKTEAQWFKEKGYQYKASALQQEMSAAWAAYAADLQVYAGPYKDVTDAVAQYTNDQDNVPVPDGGYVKMRGYILSPNPEQTINDWADGKGRNEFHYVMDHKTSQYDYSKTTWKAQAKVKYGWFSFGGSGGRTTEQKTVHSNDFKVDFKMDAWAAFDIMPGDWYNGAMLINHKNGEWDEQSRIGRGLSKAWGEGGVFPLLPTRVVLAYNPSFKVGFDQSDYKEFKENWQTSDDVCAGPFCFGGSANHEETHITTDDATQTITLTDTSGIPKILAFEYNPLNNK